MVSVTLSGTVATGSICDECVRASFGAQGGRGRGGGALDPIEQMMVKGGNAAYRL